MIGQRHTLKKFHSLGYKSFHPWINESYDAKGDKSRFHYAFVEIQKLITMSEENLRSSYKMSIIFIIIILKILKLD